MYYYIALNFVQGIGSIRYKALVSHFRSAENVLKAKKEELCKVDGIGDKLADAIKSFNDFKAVDNELKIAKRKNIKIIKYLDYPSNLRKMADSPPILYLKGDLSEEDDNAFGIVGARVASIENLTFAEDMGYKLSIRGVTIVSGMAVGIDSAAHKGALRANGRTIAVLGSGVDVIYPYSNKYMYEKISKTGAVISEFRLGTPPNKENIPRRNRIISGLSKGVLVVEANMDSGSLITADYALKQGKKVFAVPGDIRREKAKGTNSLIKKGALLVDSEDDIFDNVAFDRKTVRKSALNIDDDIKSVKNDLSENELTIYKVMKDEAMHIDDIIKNSSLQASVVSGILLNLELKEYVKQYSGKMFM